MLTSLPIDAFDFKPPRVPGPRSSSAVRSATPSPILNPIIVPFVIHCDSQEKSPFTFTNLHADADRNYRPLIVRVERIHLGVARGDYTIGGDAPDGTPFIQLFGLERKSVADAVGTILGFGDRRKRFERELEWLNGRDFAAIVVEGEFNEVLREAERHSNKGEGVAAKSLFRSVLAWQRRYPRIHWQFCPDRRFAEVYAFRQMEAFWNETVKTKKEMEQPTT